MPDHAYGKVYRVVSPNTDAVYYGATAYRLLSSRFRQHRYCARNYPEQCTSSAVVLAGGARIELVEEWPCDCRRSLQDREQHWLDHARLQGENVVNKYAASRPRNNNVAIGQTT